VIEISSQPKTQRPSRRRLTIWLLTTAGSVPLGWLVARPLARPGSDLVWAALVCGPPWVILRLMAGDFYWNAFFFGFLPPVLAFEALTALGAGPRQAALLAIAPLVVYAILGFTTAIMFFGAGAAWLAREIADLERDTSALPRRLGRWLRTRIGPAARWYLVWLGGAAVGFGLALATRALAGSVGVSTAALSLSLLSRAVVGLAAGGFAWALLWLPGSSGSTVPK
jgi:hypothetical protein